MDFWDFRHSGAAYFPWFSARLITLLRFVGYFARWTFLGVDLQYQYIALVSPLILIDPQRCVVEHELVYFLFNTYQVGEVIWKCSR
jgi:hypothetical protein